MIWAWVLVAAISIGLPAGAWRLSRNLKPPRQRTALPGCGRIDRWLLEHYQLGALDRWRVEEALFRGGRGLTEPRLREAVRGVAAELSSGRLQRLRMRWEGWFVVVMGLIFTATGLVDMLSHRLGGLAVVYIVEGGVGVVLGAVGVVWWVPRQMRRGLEQAERLNGDDAALS